METEFQPYVGPRPFERTEADQNRFFGRDHEASDLLSRITAHSAVLFYSQSGAGKTSLINAKLSPMLEKAGFEVLRPARVRYAPPQDMDTEEISNIYVFNTLRSWDENKTAPELLARVSIPEFLKAGSVPSTDHEDGTPRVVIFDQFEELFTSYQERSGDRDEFFAQMGAALEQDRLLRVVFAMREDYIAELDPYLALLPEKLRTRFRLERLSEGDALLAITEPLKGTQYSFAEGVAELLVQNLLTVPVETATGIKRVRGESVEPVQLQVVCQTLWGNCQNSWRNLPPSEKKVITREYLETFGDVDQALSSFYESAVARVVQATDAKEGVLRRWFEHSLITSAGTRGTVYRGRDEAGGVPNAAVDVLVNQHVIRGEVRGGGSRWYELTHDRLINPIKASNERWFLEHSGGEQTPKRLEARAAQWVRDGRQKEDLLDEGELLEAKRWLDSPHAADVGYSNALFALVQASRAASEQATRQREQALAAEQQSRAEAERQRAEEKQKRIEEQARANRRLRWSLGALATMFILAVGSAVFATVGWRKAETSAIAANDARRDAVEQSTLAGVQTNLAIKAKEEADKAKEDADGQRKIAEQQAALAESRRKQAEQAQQEAIQARLFADEQQAVARNEAIEANILRTLEERARLNAEDRLKIQEFENRVFALSGYVEPSQRRLLESGIENDYGSIEMLYRKYNPVGIEKTLNNLAYAYYNQGQYQKAWQHYHQLIDLKVSRNDSKGEISVLQRLKSLYYYLPPQKEAMTTLLRDRLKVRYPDGDKEDQLSVIDILAGTVEYDEKGTDYYELALPIVKADYQREIEYLRLLVIRARGKGDKIKAIGHNQTMATIYANHGESKKQAATLMDIGALYDELSQKDRAIENYRDALTAYKKDSSPGPKGEADALVIVASAIYESSRTRDEMSQYYRREAIQLYDSARQIYQKTNNKSDLLRTLSTLARVTEEFGYKQEAIDHLNELRTEYSDAKNPLSEARTLNDLARIYEDMGKKKQAIQSLHEAEGVFSRISDPRVQATMQPVQAMTLFNLGKVYQEERGVSDLKLALEFYEKAQALYHNLGDRKGEAATLNNIGLVHAELDDAKEALPFYERALGLLNLPSDRIAMALTLRNMGHALQKLGEIARATASFAEADKLDRNQKP